MTTITKERLEQIYAECEERDPAIFEIRELVRIALAALEAEPVAYIFKHPAGELFWSLTDESNKDQNDVMPVYASPPAPVAVYSVFEDFWSTCKHPYTQDDELKDFSWGIWNACRDAMLKVNKNASTELPNDANLSTNSPVSPGGWISCSERMPAQDDWVLIYSKYGEYLAGQVQGEYVELNDGTLSWLGAALHWMLLPEPPLE
ncbi:DUF551 domain-containing protein [Salmonella enterica]|uniref:DUF551 domain-containing protein n=1 Tax=Salmonella enterica TaxID=28901 RepID=A0A5U2FC10_SALER|nr:DUF551 domain-containing protein [Salmonella enterica]